MLPATRSTLPCTIICLATPASGLFFSRSTKTLPAAPARRGVPAARGCTPPSTLASPRGGDDLPEQYGRRLSFCCERDGCRKRTTPPSVRFLGRKVYLAAVVVLVAAMRQGPSPRRVRELSDLFGADRQTIARWQVFWQEHFPQTQFWKVARGRLPPGAAMISLPRSLLDIFLGQDQSNERWGRLLRFLSPITITGGLAIAVSR